MVYVAIPQSAAMARDGKVVWSVGTESESGASLQGDECIPYGVALAGAEVMSPPATLQYGVHYRVELNTDLMKQGGPVNRQYSGNFCLSRQADGEIEVHDLGLGDRAQGGAPDNCVKVASQG